MSKNARSNLKTTAKNYLLLLPIFAVLFFTSCNKIKEPEVFTISEELQITKINEHSYIHISYLNLKNGATFPCNGFIYVNNNEVYVFDTPANDKATTALINWLQNDLKVKIKGVVFNHFHNDCTEGMNVFKDQGIPTISSKKTAKLLLKENRQEPNLLFKDSLKLTLGNKSIINNFFGEAHTKDNIISYFPEEQIIYGGCMIKSLNAKKGNLADANVVEWSKTVSKIKKAYPKIKIVIPGHGEYGGTDLLDYTISLFKIED